MSSKLEPVIWLRVLVTLAYMKGRTYGRKMTSWLFYQIFSHRWVTSIFLAMVLRARAPSARAELRYERERWYMKVSEGK